MLFGGLAGSGVDTKTDRFETPAHSSDPIRPEATLKKVAPAYLSRLTAAPTRSKTAK